MYHANTNNPLIQLEILSSTKLDSRSGGFPLFEVKAGFPSPADDFIESSIDLNRHLVHNPTATFFARVRGTSMIDAGICEGDLLKWTPKTVPSFKLCKRHLRRETHESET